MPRRHDDDDDDGEFITTRRAGNRQQANGKLFLQLVALIAIGLGCGGVGFLIGRQSGPRPAAAQAGAVLPGLDLLGGKPWDIIDLKDYCESKLKGTNLVMQSGDGCVEFFDPNARDEFEFPERRNSRLIKSGLVRARLWHDARKARDSIRGVDPKHALQWRNFVFRAWTEDGDGAATLARAMAILPPE